jgi:hypothetical protein
MVELQLFFFSACNMYISTLEFSSGGAAGDMLQRESESGARETLEAERKNFLKSRKSDRQSQSDYFQRKREHPISS